MNSKKTAIIAISVLAIVISSLCAVSAFELFGIDILGGPTTDFDNKFMSGTFNGDVTQNNISEDNLTKGWTDSYEDKEHNITYNMSCVKDGEFITDVYQLQGLGAPEIRNYNDQPWKIFYSQAVPDSNVTDNKTSLNDTNDTIHVYICEADVNGTAYIINVMSYENKTECDGTLFCPLYKDFIGPLVESVEFKDAKKAPEMADLLGMSDEEFKFNREYLDGIFNGSIDPTQA
ncbi:MAG: hypothetical protein E7Z75_08650 [Methanobrevibacter olleyae]|uniref:Uncharacterized protein n=1 Tax=Methanobrevibacter olleyae TaxID=294671 RepID=A0A8T3VPG1_METOL|nr:hypothetical protein [Methanobrevibacter olleyae]